MGFGMAVGSGIRWTICKQSAPRSRQITTPTPHHSIFTDWLLFLMSKKQCQSKVKQIIFQECVRSLPTSKQFMVAILCTVFKTTLRALHH